MGPEERPEDRALFNAGQDDVAQWEAREELARWVTPGVAYHSLVLSPGPLGEGMSVEQMREWTRHVMADLDKRWGGDGTPHMVTWYAAIHQHINPEKLTIVRAGTVPGATGTGPATK